MSGLSTIERASSKMKGPEKLLWYAASATKARSTSAASVLLRPPCARDESASFPRETSSAVVLWRIPFKVSLLRPALTNRCESRQYRQFRGFLHHASRSDSLVSAVGSAT